MSKNYLKSLTRKKETNNAAMAQLSELRSIVECRGLNAAKLALNRAIDGLYMQNKIIDTIHQVEERESCIIDRNGVITMLTSALISDETNKGERITHE